MIYRSNLRCPDLEPAFSHTFREPHGQSGHDVMHDIDWQPGCGYMSHDEAAILYHIAHRVGGSWVEIGTHTGWSAAHVAIGADLVWGIDPQFSRRPFLNRTEKNLDAAGVIDKVLTWPGTSAQFFNGCGWTFDGAVIDGDHSAPMPLRDAKMLLPHLKDRAAVVLHDCVGQPTYDAVQFLIDEGFKFRVYNTPQRLTVCWRGEIGMPDHEPDPTVDWAKSRKKLPFDLSKES